ncbi:zinc transporter ZTP29 [Senna tora]|uniref:Zinc transporter ZTP29 n=1 Tax=Senna tora TaxID=362788 RepID=A0A834WM15_9FABA|nr:zinc transporter ZTP29 [Senna tora]
MDSQVTVALALSILGGLSTSIGALFVIVNQSPSLKMLGLLQAFHWLKLLFCDENVFLPSPFVKHVFFAGVIFFAIVASFIPEPTLVPTSDVKSKKRDGDEGGKDIMKKRRRQVFFSGIITAIDCETDPHCFSAIKNANTCSFGNRILVKGF